MLKLLLVKLRWSWRRSRISWTRCRTSVEVNQIKTATQVQAPAPFRYSNSEEDIFRIPPTSTTAATTSSIPPLLVDPSTSTATAATSSIPPLVVHPPTSTTVPTIIIIDPLTSTTAPTTIIIDPPTSSTAATTTTSSTPPVIVDLPTATTTTTYSLSAPITTTTAITTTTRAVRVFGVPELELDPLFSYPKPTTPDFMDDDTVGLVTPSKGVGTDHACVLVGSSNRSSPRNDVLFPIWYNKPFVEIYEATNDTIEEFNKYKSLAEGLGRYVGYDTVVGPQFFSESSDIEAWMDGTHIDADMHIIWKRREFRRTSGYILGIGVLPTTWMDNVMNFWGNNPPPNTNNLNDMAKYVKGWPECMTCSEWFMCKKLWVPTTTIQHWMLLIIDLSSWIITIIVQDP